jgi:hypothetical protein
MTGTQTFPLVAKSDNADEAGRNIIKLAVTKDAKAALTKLADHHGMKEYVVASKIYLWFIGQDDIFQRAVLGMLKGLEVDAARAFMERWAKGENREPRVAVTDFVRPPPSGPKPSDEAGGSSGPTPAAGRPRGRKQ